MYGAGLFFFFFAVHLTQISYVSSVSIFLFLLISEYLKLDPESIFF